MSKRFCVPLWHVAPAMERKGRWVLRTGKHWEKPDGALSTLQVLIQKPRKQRLLLIGPGNLLARPLPFWNQKFLKEQLTEYRCWMTLFKESSSIQNKNWSHRWLKMYQDVKTVSKNLTTCKVLRGLCFGCTAEFHWFFWDEHSFD